MPPSHTSGPLPTPQRPMNRCIGLADYYIIGKRYDDAKPILRDLAGKKERHAQAMLRLAAIDAAVDNRVEAHVKVREVLTASPANMAARLFSARLLLLEGKRDESLCDGSDHRQGRAAVPGERRRIPADRHAGDRRRSSGRSDQGVPGSASSVPRAPGRSSRPGAAVPSARGVGKRHDTRAGDTHRRAETARRASRARSNLAGPGSDRPRRRGTGVTSP